MRLALAAVAERIFGAVARWAESARERVALCRHCGRSRYSWPPCHGRGAALLLALALPGMAQEPAGRTTTYDGCNWTTCDGSMCASTTLYCSDVPGTLLPATLDWLPGDPAPPVKSEPPPHPRTVQSAGMWLSKAITLANGAPWEDRTDYWGGRLHIRIPVALAGKLALIGRADVVSVPGTSNPFANLGNASAIEAYGGAEYVLIERWGIDFAAAGVGGQVYQIATGSTPSVRLPPQTLAAGGLVAHHHRSGAWGAILVGQYDAAGPGTRVLLSGHFPIKKGFGVVVDLVTGDGGWARPGLVYGLSW